MKNLPLKQFTFERFSCKTTDVIKHIIKITAKSIHSAWIKLNKSCSSLNGEYKKNQWTNQKD